MDTTDNMPAMEFAKLQQNLKDLYIDCQMPEDLYLEFTKLCDFLEVPMDTVDNILAKRIAMNKVRFNHPDGTYKIANKNNLDKDEVNKELTEKTKIIIMKVKAFKLLVDVFNFPHPSQAQSLICNPHKLIFTKKIEFDAHMTSHQFKCNQCEYTSTNIESLNTHTQTHKKFSCDTCNKQFTTKGNLKTHKQIHNNVITSCTICRIRLGRQRDLLDHNRTVHLGEKTMCKLDCGRSFNTQRNEARHRMEFHKTEKDLECGYKVLGCEFKTKHKSCLESHVLSQHTL